MTSITAFHPVSSRRSLHRFQAALWIGALISAALCLSSLKAQAMSQTQEIALGKRLTREAVRTFGSVLPATSPLAQRVTRIGRKFAALSGRKGIPFTYQVLNNRKVLNAFSAPGGPVFITRRLVEFTRNDAELAAVLGHETGHIEHRDAARNIEGREQAQRSMAQSLARSGASRAEIRRLQAVNGFSYDITSLENSCDDESAADATGIRWMAQLGYDPNAMLTMFARMYQEEQKTGAELFYLRTHPPTADRFAVIQAQIANESLLEVAQVRGGARLWDAVVPQKAPHAVAARQAKSQSAVTRKGMTALRK